MRAGYAAAAALAIFAAGTVAGYYLPHRFEESIARMKIGSFRQCVAPLRQHEDRSALTWDPAAKQREDSVMAAIVDCTNRSGIGGLSIGEIECASGYSAMPYEAYVQVRRSDSDTPSIESIIRTHRKPIASGYCR